MQFASFWQLVAHWPSVPEQRYGAQLGRPVLEEERSVQVPLATAPSEAAHVSHEPEHVLSQQKPSAQLPERH